MAIDYASHVSWHEGEQQMHSLLHLPETENPTSYGLAPYGLRILQRSPLLAIGTLDDDGRPWTTLLGGEPGFARYLGRQSIIGVEALADRIFDPVLSALTSSRHQGEITQHETDGRIIAGLAINLATRERVKLSGRIIVGSFGQSESSTGEEDNAGNVQLIMKIEQSLGTPNDLFENRNLETIASDFVASHLSMWQPSINTDLIADLVQNEIVQPAVALVTKVDLFFISSSYRRSSMGTNDRGGAPGFVRVLRNDALETTLVFPEFSGNRLYQTLGNLKTNPLTGLLFPDFDTGDVLYATCTTEIVVGKAAAALLPRSNLAVIAKVIKARFVRHGLAFRGTPGEQSPYNPPIRYLGSERMQADAQTINDRVVYANLLQKEILTPTIARLRFSVSDPEAAGRWDPGQYVALAFEDELSAGYSHMRDDDPKSLNDDYVRTFTVSSAMGQNLPDDEFEITMRNVGVVSGFLFRQQVRAGLEVPLKGFGGNFKISQPPREIVAFIAGGVGITPLLASLPQLDIDRMKIFWTVNIRDIGLVTDTFRRNPLMDASTTLFVSGIKDHIVSQNRSSLSELERSRASLVTRRMIASDVQADLVSKWYVCTGKALRQSILLWLPGKEVVYEDFNY